MLIKKEFWAVCALLLCMNFNSAVLAGEQAKETKSYQKYPDYAYEFLGKDKFEKFNRKIFKFNMRLNKCALKPVHVIWASVMPKYGMDRIQSATTNIEYPIRLASCLLQRDFKASKNETVRFLTNTTIGLGGLYDPAKKLLKIEPVQENMEQALAKCKCRRGPYIVFPVLNATSPRDLFGRILDTGLNPSSYIGSPVLAMVKAGIVVNRTSYMQPMIKMLESTYADPYEIGKKLYGLENYIKFSNYDRKDVLDEASKIMVANPIENETLLNISNDVIKGSAEADAVILKENKADIELQNYKPQCPVTDSMRTALFEVPGLDSKVWTELSVWNRSFSKRIKTGSISAAEGRDDYKFKYILQKDRTAPAAIIYPSIGEGVNSHHSVVLAKIFYDEGYSVVIQGSHFQWEFVKSMPADYRPGLPANDAKFLRQVTSKIFHKLEEKENYKPNGKVVLGTSFGALETLFLGDLESKENTLNITKYISINPPFDLLYAMRQMDKNSEEWAKNPNDLQKRVALTAAKVIDSTKHTTDGTLDQLPFSEDEAKLITGFVMHQKLSDLVFTIENSGKVKHSEFYAAINDMNYQDYAKKYLLNEKQALSELEYEASLASISDFLKKRENYTIYHTLDDYLITPKQLSMLKTFCSKNAVYLSNGGHLGFLYRKEFQDNLKEKISLKNVNLVENVEK